MKRLFLFTVTLLCVALIFHMAMGQVAKKKAVKDSRYLQYEGILTNPSGENVTGEYTVTFTIYDSPDAAVPLWVEIHDVYVKEGEFKVTLGKNTPLPSRDTENSHIGVSINGEELLPRQVVRSAGPGDDTLMRDFPRHRELLNIKDDDWDYWTSAPDMYSIPDGNVGIGTMIPSSKLHVEGSDTVEALAFIDNTDGGFGLIAGSTGSSSTMSQIGVFAGAEGPGLTSVGIMNAAVNNGEGHAYGSYGAAATSGSGFATGTWSQAFANNSTGAALGISTLGENLGSGLATGGLFNTTHTGTGTHYGVQAFSFGESSSPNIALHTYGQNVSDGDAYGGFFDVLSWGTGTHYGLFANSNGNSIDGAYGVYGNATNLDGKAYGGYFTTSADGPWDCHGVYIDATADSYARVYGIRVEALNYGPNDGAIAGFFNCNLEGEGDHYGVRGQSYGSSSDDTYGVHGRAINSGSNGNTYGGFFTTSEYGGGIHYGVYGEEAAGGSGAAVYAAGDMIASGAKPAVVRTSSGHRLLYAQESPEVWFEDFGEGQLSSGRTHIELDALFLETVTIDDNHPVKVFVQLEGDCKGTYVSKGNTGFDVVELQGGTSDAVFSYRVVAKRKGFEDERLRMTDVGYDDTTLYPELLAEREREYEEELQRNEREKLERRQKRERIETVRQQTEKDRQQVQEEQQRMKDASLTKLQGRTTR